jgi:phage baseplate assembly protein W
VANAHLLKDMRLQEIDEHFRRFFKVAERETRAPARPERLLDFDVVGDRSNLVQAIAMRLLTPRGELAALGHPEYGSRLHELIGRENTDTTRNLMKLFILEALQFEPRLQPKTDVIVRPAETNPPATGKGARNVRLASHVVVQIAVLPVGETDKVVIGPFTLELGP